MINALQLLSTLSRTGWSTCQELANVLMATFNFDVTRWSCNNYSIFTNIRWTQRIYQILMDSELYYFQSTRKNIRNIRIANCKQCSFLVYKRSITVILKLLHALLVKYKTSLEVQCSRINGSFLCLSEASQAHNFDTMHHIRVLDQTEIPKPLRKMKFFWVTGEPLRRGNQK